MTPPKTPNQPSLPMMYEQLLVPAMFRPVAALVLDRLALQPGDRVLDVASGTGIVARLAREKVGPSGKVVGVDLSPGMLEVARAADASIDWREGNAQSLPVGDTERFDVVICQQGLQFFPDRPAALREMRRVLAPGGRLGVATWFALEDIPIFHEIHRIAERRLGPITDQRHSFGDPNAMAALLTDAGFSSVVVEPTTITVRFADGAPFARLNAMALVGMSAAGKGMTDEERRVAGAAIAEESATVLRRFQEGNAVVFEIGSIIATGRA